MNSKEVRKTVSVLAEIVQRLESLDPAVRAETVGALAHVYQFSPSARKGMRIGPRWDTTEDDPSAEPATFFSRFAHTKAADNVLLIAAWLYSQRGRTALTKAILDQVATSAGLTIPARSDNTMRQAKRNHLAMFDPCDEGWKLTPAGEEYIRATYGVRPPADALLARPA